MPIYKFTLPEVATDWVITITDGSGGVVDTIGVGASSGSVSTVSASGNRLVISADLPVGEYRASSADVDSWGRRDFVTSGVLDIPATLDALPGTIDSVVDATVPPLVTAEVKVRARNPVALSARIAQPLITIMCDDGYTQDQTLVRPILEAHGVRGVFAVHTGAIGLGGRLSYAQLASLQAGGHEIANHGATHISLSSATALQIQTEIYGAHDTFVSNGVTPTGYVFAQSGQGNQAARLACRDLYEWATASGSTTIPVAPPLDTFALSRQSFSDATPGATMTGYIDTAITNKRWLILFVHSGTGLTDGSSIETALNYAEAQGVPVVTLTEGLALIGNLYDAGDRAQGNDGAVVDALGRTWSNGGNVAARFDLDTAIGVSSFYDAFPQGFSIRGAVGSGPGGVNGTLVNFRPIATTGNAHLYSVQYFYEFSGDKTVWMRTSTGATSWSTWRAVNYTMTRTTTPVASQTPTHIGQIVVDTVTKTGFMAVGLTNADWKQITA